MQSENSEIRKGVSIGRELCPYDGASTSIDASRREVRSCARTASHFGPILHFFAYSAYIGTSKRTNMHSQAFLGPRGSLRKPERGYGRANIALQPQIGLSNVPELRFFAH